MNEGPNTTLRDLDRAARANGGVIRLARGTETEELVRSIGGGVSRKRVVNVLGDLAAAGSVLRAGSGRYLLPVAERGAFNPVAAGPRLTRGRAYVSMWNVAERARLTTNTPRLVSVIVDRAPTQLVLRLPSLDTIFYFHQISSKRFFGFSEESLGDGLTTPMAGVEKALIDMLWFTEAPDTPPAFEIFAIWEEAAATAALNPKLLVKHAVRMESPAIARRVGYLMDRFGIRHADDLLAHRGAGKRPVPLLRADEPLDLGPNRWLVS